LNKTKIEWVKNPDGTQGYTSNPIRGLCPMACKLPDGRVYCYEARRRQRFKIPINFEFHQKELRKIENAKGSRGIFLGSTIELFHDMIPYDWRRSVFKTIRACPQHRFYILTKLPQNIDREMPDNMWLGVSITGNTHEDFNRASFFGFKPRKAKVQFISYEPILEEPVRNIPNVDWIVVGRLTGHGKKYDPKIEWIQSIIKDARDTDTPVFLKDNLIPIVGQKLVSQYQEFPE